MNNTQLGSRNLLILNARGSGNLRKRDLDLAISSGNMKRRVAIVDSGVVDERRVFL